MFSKDKIAQTFCRSARYYDRYAFIQNQIAAMLAGRLKNEHIRNILEIGCGTGNYTSLLKQRFPQANITSMDISLDMIKVAKGKINKKEVNFFVADAEETHFWQDFDLITSNACMQWFSDLGGSFFKYKPLLKERGFFVFSLFGPQTFYELKRCLNILKKGKITISADYFLDFKQVSCMLGENFSQSRAEEKTIFAVFPSLRELLYHIKYTGGVGFSSAQMLNTRAKLNELEKIYQKEFGGFKLSYQVFLCEGRK